MITCATAQGQADASSSPKIKLFLQADFYYRHCMQTGEALETIEQLACAVRERGLTAPAIFALELSKPLVGCLRELYNISESIQLLLFGRELVPALQSVLSSSERVEELIRCLEGNEFAAGEAP
jgi:hypothetical protein